MAAWLVTTIASNVVTLGRGAAIGFILLLVGLNLLLTLMVIAVIDGTFAVLRRALPDAG